MRAKRADGLRETGRETADITASVDGEAVVGCYEVLDGRMVVKCPYGSTSAAVGGLPNRDLAIMLLREIVRMNQLNGKYALSRQKV